LKFQYLSIFICTLVLSSCSSSPLGRKQLILFPTSKMDAMGVASFSQMKTKTSTIKDPSTYNYIKCITDRLLIAMNEKPSEWQIEVFKDDTPNAFALPGKKMGIHSGMITLAKNQDQIAAVIGHEIGHVIAQHSNERMSQQTLAQAGLEIGSVALGSGKQTDSLITGALGLGVQYGVLMPFSRTHETEADRLGQMYMAKAGFDPRQAAELWKVMSKGAGQSPPEFLSSHPSNESRINDLSQRAEKYMADYQSSNKTVCKQ
jgi:predicted Zn-dependent protease